MKEIVVAVLASLATATALWLIGLIGKIPDILTIPTGAVVAFDANSCPSEGWKEYKAAYGKFVRGIDKSGTGVDPDGERKAGTPQSDSVKSHTHKYTTSNLSRSPRDGGFVSLNDSQKSKNYDTGSFGGDESRPKNVALLYCVKT